MADDKQLPFQSFSFTLVENRKPRSAFSLIANDDEYYALRVQKGAASNPSAQFERNVPVEVAERLRDALQAIGVFGWDESYGDSSAPGSRRWTVRTVFKEGVFSVESRGGSDVPSGFEDMLEELYRLDFPRLGASRGGTSAACGEARGPLGFEGRSALSAGDLGAYASGFPADVDFTQLASAFQGGLPAMDAGSMQDLLSQVGTDPLVLQQRLREEYRRLSPSEQSQMLDALAASGLASRVWWERFFKGM